jgi:cytoskeletal protein CcmA (bactofilin family)
MAWFERKRQDSEVWTGFLERGVKLDGKLEVSGTFRIDSEIKGIIRSEDTLILGAHSVVEGEIAGNRVIVSGRFDGIIRAKGKVEIQANAIVTGEVHSPCLVIDPGAIFDGQCHMLGATEAAKPITIPIRSVASAGPTQR